MAPSSQPVVHAPAALAALARTRGKASPGSSPPRSPPRRCSEQAGVGAGAQEQAYEEMMGLLTEMGFSNAEMSRALLNEYRGDLQRVIDRLTMSA